MIKILAILFDSFTIDLSGLIVGIIGALFGLVGIVISICSQISLKKEKQRNKSFIWDDINPAVKKMIQKAKQDFKVDVIYVPSFKGGIIVQLTKDYFDEYIPVIVGQAIPKKQYNKCKTRIINIDDYYLVETNIWEVLIPKSIMRYKGKNVLIIDDLAITGDFLQAITQKLILEGINIDNIKSACIATTIAAVRDETEPNFYSKVMEASEVSMPWS